ncbi:DUF3800 domain-containing protein [Tardiphaga robiniae]|uniref:DUF3800 domain-containing protein n=1 Tax=Tardiphaga robiniae TaxID=943830 RepID=A0A163Y7L7_9BRAD|nr:DUF3800 domain-containing protein [Tardiphaga robiniae]KZD21906.1 hypothetical protein A4A58_12430 [Tardiphaga robiniae]
MLAFIDGSGTINDSPVYVMAGYLARADAWEAFTIEWKAALDHPKAIKYFKMSEAFSRRGQFAGWDEALRDARLRMLPSIVNRHAISAIIFAVSSDGWKNYAVGRLNEKYHDRPYFFAFHTIMASAVKYLAEKGIREKIDFVFDEEGGESSRLMLESFDGWAEVAPSHLKEYIGQRPIYRDEKNTLPLQAADLLAWHVRRSFAEGIQGKDVSQLSSAMPELFEVEQARSLWDVNDVKRSIDGILVRSFILGLNGVPLTLPDPTTAIWISRKRD